MTYLSGKYQLIEDLRYGRGGSHILDYDRSGEASLLDNGAVDTLVSVA